MNGFADEVRGLMIAVFLRLAAVLPEDFHYVERGALEHDICGRERAYIAARPGKWHPGSRLVLLCFSQERRQRVVGKGVDVVDQVGPVEKRRWELDAIWWNEHSKIVCYGDSMAVRVHPGFGSQ